MRTFILLVIIMVIGCSGGRRSQPVQRTWVSQPKSVAPVNSTIRVSQFRVSQPTTQNETTQIMAAAATAMQQADFERAAPLFKKLAEIQIGLNSSMNYINAAIAYKLCEKDAEAIICWRKAVAIGSKEVALNCLRQHPVATSTIMSHFENIE